MEESQKSFETPSERNSAMFIGCGISFFLNTIFVVIVFFGMAFAAHESAILVTVLIVSPILANVITLIILFKKKLKYVAFGYLVLILAAILVFGVCLSTFR